MDISRALSPVFLYFLSQIADPLQCDDEEIRSADLWCRKEPICQTCHNHGPMFVQTQAFLLTINDIDKPQRHQNLSTNVMDWTRGSWEGSKRGLHYAVRLSLFPSDSFPNYQKLMLHWLP